MDLKKRDYSKLVSVSEVTAPPPEVSRFFTSVHSERGTLVHSICEKQIKTAENLTESVFCKQKNRDRSSALKKAEDSYFDTLDLCATFQEKGHDKGYIESCNKLKEFKLEPLLLEKRLFDWEANLCGKVDFVGTIEGVKGLGVVDFKTSTNIYKKEWKLQLSGYALLLSKYSVFPEWGGTIRIRKAGTKPIFDLLLKDKAGLDEHIKLFLETYRDLYPSNFEDCKEEESSND